MPVFEYRALDAAGAPKNGILDADSAREAREKLRKQSFFVTSIQPLSKSGSKGGFHLPRFMQKRRLNDVALVTRQLATLLHAGIPLTQSLSALIEQIELRDLSSVFRDIREKVTQGAGLAEALGNHPGYFTDLFVNMVKAGEASGSLDVVLARLADYMQKQNRLRNKVGAALAYPMIMVIMGVIVVGVLMTFVVPKILQLTSAAKKELPLITEILIAVSGFLGEYWLFVLAAPVLLFFGLQVLLRNPKWRLKFDTAILDFPVLGDLLRKSAVSRFANTFSTLLRSGIPALDALGIVRNVVSNRLIADTLGNVHQRIVEGTDIATPLKKSGVFPPVVGYMVAVGEQTGHLEDMLDKIVETYEEEVEIATQKMTSVMEPIIIIALASVVAFIVLAILLPILEIGDIQGV